MTTVYAHRGAAVERPENTLSSFQRALELGADALESDAWLTRDGVVVLSHDADGGRMAGVPARIADTSFSELKSWDAGWGFVDANGERPFAARGHRVPALEELLAATPGVRLNVDLKSDDPALVERFVDTVRRAQAEERVTGASFDHRTLRRLRKSGFRGETSLARLEFLAAWLVPAWLYGRPPGERAQIPTRSGHFDLSTRRVFFKLRRLGLKVDYWTVNDPLEAARLVALGADGIMTDDPARIVPAVREAELSQQGRA